MTIASAKYILDELPPRTKTKLLYNRARPQFEMALAKVSRKIRKLLVQNDINAQLRIRVKTFDSYFDKIIRFYNQGRKENVQIQDIMGIRVICNFIGDLEIIQHLLVNHFDVIELESKSSNHSIRDFGYDSIHLLLKLPKDWFKSPPPFSDHTLEVQLRTKLQDAWAEVEHELIYKSDFSLLNGSIKRKLASINASLTLSDIIFQEIRDYHRERVARDEKRRKSIQSKIESITSLHELTDIQETKESDKDHLAVDLPNDSLDRLLFKALDAHSKQDYNQALRYYNKILKTSQDDTVRSIISNHRGMVYFVLSNYDKAIQDFTMAIQTNSKNFRAYNNRALAYRMMKKYDRALEDFERSIELDATQIDAYFGRAQLFFELEDFPKALSDCNHVLNIQPDYKSARRFLQLIQSKIY